MSQTERFYDVLKKKLNEPLPSAQASGAGNAEAMGMLSAQAGPAAVAEASDDKEDKNPNGLKADLIKDKDYANAVRNLTNCEKDIEELRGKISDDMDADERKKVLAKLAEKQDYLKTLRAKLKLAEVKAREKLKKEKEKSTVKESVDEMMSEAGVSTYLKAKAGTRAVNNAEKVFRKNSEYKSIADRRNKVLEQIVILQTDIEKYLRRSDFEKAAPLRAKSDDLTKELEGYSKKLSELQTSIESTLPKSYWVSTIKQCERLSEKTRKNVENAERALNSINAQKNPEVRDEYSHFLKINQAILKNYEKYIESCKKRIEKKDSSTVKESADDDSDGDYVREANIFQKAAIKTDTLVDKMVMKDYRKDANYKAIDNNMRSLNEKIKEMDIDIARLESKEQYDKAESLRAQQQRLVNQHDKLSLQEIELRAKVEDNFPKSHWRKQMESQRKLIEKLQSRLDRAQRRLDYFKRQSEKGDEDGGMIEFYEDIVKEREDNVKMAAGIYDAMQRKYDTAQEN